MKYPSVFTYSYFSECTCRNCGFSKNYTNKYKVYEQISAPKIVEMLEPLLS